MIRNLFAAALVAALCAGLVTSVIQHFRLTPMIFAAESYEGAGEEAHSHDAGTPAHSHADDEWMPQDGLERTGFTIVSNILASAGYALIIGAVAVLFNVPLNAGTGLLWGLAGFAAFTLAPSFGLPPGLPTMPVADTFARQIWWAGTAIASGAAFLLIVKFRVSWAFVVAAALLIVPHIIGAPRPPDEATGVPAGLAAAFASAVIVNGAVLWVVLGVTFGLVHDRLSARHATPAGVRA
jgi:cobalt transporter subunit CbtA